MRCACYAQSIGGAGRRWPPSRDGSCVICGGDADIGRRELAAGECLVPSWSGRYWSDTILETNICRCNETNVAPAVCVSCGGVIIYEAYKASV